MGQTKSFLNEEPIVVLKEMKSYAFGITALCQTKMSTRQIIAIKARYSNHQPSFYLTLQHPNTLFPLTYEPHFKEFLDLDAEGVNFYFDYLEVSLKDIINERRKQNLIFLEEEIIAVVDALLSALEYLKTQGIEGGNIEPSTIFYDKGKIKIYLNELILGKYGGYKLTQEGFWRQAILAPEQLWGLKRRDIQLVERYQESSEVFCLGLSLLEMCCLLRSQDLMDLNNHDYKVELLNERINLVGQKYSKSLMNLIIPMVELDPNLRHNLETLRVSFGKYKQEIAQNQQQIYIKTHDIIAPIVSQNPNIINHVNPQFEFQQCQELKPLGQQPIQQQIILPLNQQKLRLIPATFKQSVNSSPLKTTREQSNLPNYYIPQSPRSLNTIGLTTERSSRVNSPNALRQTKQPQLYIYSPSNGQNQQETQNKQKKIVISEGVYQVVAPNFDMNSRSSSPSFSTASTKTFNYLQQSPRDTTQKMQLKLAGQQQCVIYSSAQLSQQSPQSYKNSSFVASNYYNIPMTSFDQLNSSPRSPPSNKNKENSQHNIFQTYQQTEYFQNQNYSNLAAKSMSNQQIGFPQETQSPLRHPLKVINFKNPLSASNSTHNQLLFNRTTIK